MVRLDGLLLIDALRRIGLAGSQFADANCDPIVSVVFKSRP